QRVDHVHRDVHQAIPARVQPASGVVDRERQADERTPGKRRPWLGWRERRRHVPDLFVDDDGVVVIEDKRRRKSIGIQSEGKRRQDKSQNPNPKTRIPSHWLVGISFDLGFGIWDLGFTQLLPPRWSRTW